MSPEEQKYYENYFDLFMTNGWEQFVKEISDTLDSHRIEDIRDEQQLAFLKGERSSLFKIRRFETGIKSAYDVLTRDSNA